MVDVMKRAMDRLAVRLRGRRRGSILVFALGVLAILAIMSVGYVTVVRIDRGSSAAVVRQTNYQQQVDAVVGHIKNLLAADLFGNKIVDRTTPRASWPRPFEDGEYWDYPTIDEPDARMGGYTFDRSEAGSFSTPNARITFEKDQQMIRDPRGYFPAARPDDAWLASTEPAWGSPRPNNGDQTWWSQITNLRSGWRYNTNRNNPDDKKHWWERGDGRFADLGRFFDDPRTVDGARFGNAGVDLLKRDFRQEHAGGLGAERGSSLINNSRETSVYHMQMANLTGNDAIFESSDERFWVDTDGDLRPDARWTQLDSLGNLYGLVWVTAARIIDASALVNVNTSIDFWNDSGLVAPQYGNGVTPADVDLVRLVSTHQDRINIGQYFQDVETNRVRNALNEHIQLGLGFDPDFVSDLKGSGVVPINQARSDEMLRLPLIDAPSDLTTYAPRPVNPGGRSTSLTADQRQVFYELGALALENSVSPFADHYEVRDLRDLMAYWGTNEDRVLSKLEQHIDGPLDTGYLPGSGNNLDLWGPMRARETAAEAREFGVLVSQRKPTLQQMKFSVRRLLTTVSGVGAASPVPVLNEHIGSKVIREKINLRDLSSTRRTVDVPRMFEALVWALAPFVTDQPVMSDTRISTQRVAGEPLPDADDIDPDHMSKLCYGGSAWGNSDTPAEAEEALSGAGPVAGVHAVFTAASLAANIQDAGDEDSIPTVIRFVRDRVTDDDPNTNEVELGRRLAQGDIPIEDPPLKNHLPGQYFGVGGALGSQMTFVGMERQPFITEVVTGAWYSTASADIPGADDDALIVGTDVGNQMGSMVVVEVMNPWSEAIVITPDSFMFVIPFSEDSLVDSSGGNSVLADSMVFELSQRTIAPGTVERFTYFNGRGDGAWDDEGFEARLESQYGGESMTLISDHVNNEASVPVIFSDFIEPDSGPYRPMLLMRSIAGQLYLVDRVVPNETTALLPMPAGIAGVSQIGPGAIGGGAVFANIGGPVNEQYFIDFGYPDAPGDRIIDDDRYRLISGSPTGRLSVIGSMRRPGTERTVVDGGFPASVLAFNGQTSGDPMPRNEITLNMDVNVWLHPVDTTGPTNDPLDALTLRDTALHLVDDRSVPFVEIDPVENHVVMRTGLGDPKKSNDGLVLVDDFPGFQFKTPRGTALAADDGFVALSELHQVCLYTHTCADNQVWDLTAWTTVSEKLALARDYAHVGTTSVSNLNPYMGVLDPTRYIPGDDIATNDNGAIHTSLSNIADSMRVPLALRVFDVFDALPRRDSGRGRGDVQMGRVNVNTAPAEVLMTLPFVAPEFDITDGGTVLPRETALLAEEMNRVASILAYRGDTSSLSTPQTAPFNTQSFQEPADITGLRVPGASTSSRLREEPNGFTKLRPYGFASIGELATLHQFDSSGPVVVPEPTALAGGSAAFDGFMTFGADGIQSPNPATVLPGEEHPLDVTPSGANIYDPNDDPEERLAMFRAISNIATQRSDVYLAWFVLRGYSPDVIEQIPVTGGGVTAVEEAMNQPQFRPAYETRWLAVLDRSNVRTPLDRPEVLLLVELPSTSP